MSAASRAAILATTTAALLVVVPARAAPSAAPLTGAVEGENVVSVPTPALSGVPAVSTPSPPVLPATGASVGETATAAPPVPAQPRPGEVPVRPGEHVAEDLAPSRPAASLQPAVAASVAAATRTAAPGLARAAPAPRVLGHARSVRRPRIPPGAHGQLPRSPAANPAPASPTGGAAGASRHPAVRDLGPAAHRGRSHPFGSWIPLPLPVPDWSRPIILALALLAGAFGARAAFSSSRARRLGRAHALLLEDVGALQAALMFEPPSGVTGADVSVAYRPAEGPAAGGDFCDVFTISDTRLALILGDVVGHGRAALGQAVLTRYTIRAYLQAGMTPRAALSLAGTALARPGCELLATVAVATFDLESGTLTYALAGHPSPIFTGVEVPEPPLSMRSPPLGWTQPTGRRQATVALGAGAGVCFFTDGLTEARCEGARRLLGRERLTGLVESLAAPPDAEALLDAVRRVARNTPDDMAACILRSHVELVWAGHAEELEVDGDDLAAGRARGYLEAAGLAPAAAGSAIAEAELAVTAHGAAVLHLHDDGGGLAVSVGPGATPALGPLAASAHLDTLPLLRGG